VTVDPVFTVSVAGLKAKFLIMTAFEPPAGTRVVATGAGEFCGEVQPAHMQVRTNRITHARENRVREFKVIVFLNSRDG
jgi:hypothetical protein